MMFFKKTAAPGLAALLLSLALLGTASHTPGESPGQESCAAEIDRLMAQNYGANEPGAAILVSRHGQVVLKKGYGMASLEYDIPIGPATVFRLASLTKVFTSAAVFMLVERGRVNLDDDIRKYLPDFPGRSGTITVANLLSHTSGLGEYIDRPDNMQWVRNEYTLNELIASFKDKERMFAPGEKDVYCNSNYILLGAIIERVSGSSFGEFIRTRIFEPLGMKNSYYDASREIVPGRAAAYEPFRGKNDKLDWKRFTNARFYTMSSLYAAGGCLSTVEDLHKFQESLAGGTLLKKETVNLSLEPVKLADGRTGKTSRGGWQLDTVQGHRAVMKGGALPGVCTWLVTLPDDGITVILLSNRTPGEPRCGGLAIQLAEACL
jgi:D-alanyl-D-alanine carboxypeptidase